jgi:Ca2+-binding RTX toxin-like protein
MPGLAFDTLPLDAPTGLTLTAGSDSGASSTDGVTNDDTPTVTGTAEAGVTVTLYDTDGVTVLGSDVADGAGDWEITALALSEGVHSLTAKATDGPDVSSASTALAVTIDSTAPTATIVLADSSLQGGESTQVTVTFSEAVTGFTRDDLTAPHGVLSALTTSDNVVYTGTFTAAAGVTHANNNITLDNSLVADSAGNVGSGTTPSASYSVDAGPPPQPQPEPQVVTVVTPEGNQVTGNAEDNLIAPSGGADTVSAGGGDDTVQGGASNDVLQGNVGDDRIEAGDGSDLALGGQNQDFLQGNGGADQLFGDKGEDTVHGGQGGDFVHGGQGHDLVFGDNGDDIVLGGQGNDTVFGGAGNDYLSGDLGDDILFGGAGADTFRGFGGGGRDVVGDFNQADGDRVLLDPGTSYVVSQVGANVHITMTGGGVVVLGDVQLSSLTDGWLVV